MNKTLKSAIIATLLIVASVFLFFPLIWSIMYWEYFNPMLFIDDLRKISAISNVIRLSYGIALGLGWVVFFAIFHTSSSKDKH